PETRCVGIPGGFFVVETLGNGVVAITRDGIQDPGSGIREVRLAYAVRDQHRVWVFMNGRTVVVEGNDRDEDTPTHATDDQMALSAPMPATVLAITVAPGQEVAAAGLLDSLAGEKRGHRVTAPP